MKKEIEWTPEMKEAIEYAERELDRAERHLKRFAPGGKFAGKPENFRRDAEDEVILCRDRLEKMKKSGEYVPREKFTGGV